MPVFNRFWIDPATKQSDRARLGRDGPALQVEIGIPSKLAEVLEKAGKPIPPPHPGLALLDTGASISGVDRAILQALGVPPVSTTKVVTPSGEEEQFIYPCRITFPGTPIPPLDLNAVTGGNPLPGFAALIGRDLLQHFLLIYNGVDGFWTLAF